MPTRRHFLETVARGVPAWCALGPWRGAGADTAQGALSARAAGAPVARYWTSGARATTDCGACHDRPAALDRSHRHVPDSVKCGLCAQACVIPAGGRGQCRVRVNVRGELRSLSYGRPLSINVDPIEKKPFYHFLPGRTAWSMGTAGCPLRCKFCQNWQISQADPGDYDVAFLSPGAAVAQARQRQAPVLAFTYNEPTVFAEYVLDTAAIARAQGLRSVMVSCGIMTERPLADFCEALDAIKIDLKGFSEDFYRKVSGAALAPVLRSIRHVHRRGVHLELVNLVVPTLNDSDASLRALADWVCSELGPDVPLHFTRFYPNYQLLNLPPTPTTTLERAREMAMARGLRYVYVGNVPGHPGNHTYCPGCRAVVIERENFFVTNTRLRAGACAACGTPIPGVWS